ncbi:MAG: hypothetical protein HKM04_06860 [Legionellales bacterium]|nr:hypothetical protein [Legionellales bacterium]
MSERHLGYSEIVENRLNIISPHNIIITGLINQVLPQNIIKDALNNIKFINPLLNVNITTQTGFYSYQRLSNDSRVSIEFYTDNELDMEKTISELISHQLSIKNSPLAKLIQIENNQNTYLFFIFQHSISDGISAVNIFLEFLIQIDTILSGINPNNTKKKLNRSLEDFLFQKTDYIKNKKIAILNENFLSSQTKIANRYTAVRNLKFSIRNTEKLLKISKINKVSVTTSLVSILKTCLDEIEWGLGEENNLQCKLLVNFRNELNNHVKKNDLGFYSGCLKIPLNKIIQFNLLANDIQSKIQKQLANKEHILNTKKNQILINKCININQFFEQVEEKNTSFGVSNMGIIENVAYKNFELIDIHVACDTHIFDRGKNNFFICVNTFKNCLYINLLYPQPLFTSQQMDMIANKLSTAICSI